MRDMDLLQFWLKGVIGGISKGGCPSCSGCRGTSTGLGLVRLPWVAVLLRPCTCTAGVRPWASSVRDAFKTQRHNINRPPESTPVTPAGFSQVQ